MKKFYLFLIGFMLCGVINAQDAPPAGTPVISLTTTTAGATVRMRMQAAVANTPVWIETAPNTYTPVTVGTSWTDFTNYTPTGTSLKVYGAITDFDCNGESNGDRNPVSTLDASGNTNLQTLYCHYNQLTSLDVQGLTQLNTLWCYNNELTSLNVQGLTQLNYLYCSYNQLQSLDVQGLTQLNYLYCSYNQLTSLDVQGLTQLNYLDCDNNQLTSLNVQGLTQLIDLRCHTNQLTSLNVQGLTQLYYLYCYNNQLTSLDVQGLTQLKDLRCHTNQLTSLNVQGLTQLYYLYCYNNQLTSLDVQGLTQLKNLECYNNPCTSTTLGLDWLYCQLPQRQPDDNARILVSEKTEADLEAFVLATNGVNANSKNWKIYSGTFPNYYEITNTTGTHVCETGIEAVKSTVSIYPNPASNNITVETEAFGSTITITDLLGRTVMTATATATKTTLNISSLTAGTYVVRVGDRMEKVVKM